MRFRALGVLLASLLLVLLTPQMAALAQDEPPVEPAGSDAPLSVFTPYPSLVIGLDDTAIFNLTLQTATATQVVDLEVQGLPEGWTATFRGSNRVVQAVTVQPGKEATVELRVEPPPQVESGRYNFTVVAQGRGTQAELPLTLTVQERVPARLAFEVELPTLRGRPNTTFRYSVTLKNEGDEDLSVNLLAQAPPAFDVTFRSTGQEVTTIPLEANGSEQLSVEVDPLLDIMPAGSYPITITAQSQDGETTATVELTAEITGQSSLVLTTPDGRLSGQARAGETTAFRLLVQNTGSAPARAIELSATQPGNWTVEFEPALIEQVEPGGQVEVTARVRPSGKALAGDYVVTFRAQPEEGASESVEYRVTVRTSTAWGIVGVALIAVAVAVVGLAVMRFGRR